MNNKRQTVWLVSMLCLMVVLSAYYLFTEDSGISDDVSSSVSSAGEIPTEQLPAGETSAASRNAQSAGNVRSGAQSGQELLARLELQQMTELGKKMEQLTEVAADSRRPKEETAKAAEQLRQMEDEYDKITYIQEKLEAEYQFPNTVVMKENGRWNIYVGGDKLEKSEAASIATLVMQELNARPDQITIKVVR